jgi:hypothetical protein
MGKSSGEPQAGPELDALVLHVVMGWQWLPVQRPGPVDWHLLCNPERDESQGEDAIELPGGRLLPRDAPKPSHDPAAAREVEAEIERRCCQYPYTVALVAIALGRDRKRADWRDAWAAARATPDQRCRAALRAIGYGGREAAGATTGTGFPVRSVAVSEVGVG